MRKFLVILSALFFFSCVKIPTESVSLSTAIQEEGYRMHRLNIALLNTMFEEKKIAINSFIDNEYTPAYIDTFMRKLPQGTDVKSEFKEIMAAIMPVIEKRRQKLHQALEEQKTKLFNKLNEDYRNYEKATTALTALLSSAGKVNKSKTDLYNQLKDISGNKLDLSSIEKAVDKFVYNTGDIGQSISTLNDEINKLINNR